MTAPWEHFNEWKKINSEGEQGIVSLETVIRGMCEPLDFLTLSKTSPFLLSYEGA